MRAYRGAAVVAIVSLPSVALALALTAELGLPRLAREADVVARGTVAELQSSWDRTESAIYTDVTLAVDQVVAARDGMNGNANFRVDGQTGRGQLVFRIGGGEVGDVGMRTSNDPVLQEGERIIVFLATEGDRVKPPYLYADGGVWREAQHPWALW
jgi:predicted methyltransferase MtxX (methanogen marker protein 4)